MSEFPNPLDQDIAAVMFNPKTGMLTLRAIEGQGDFRQGDFKDSGEKDDDGYLIYREVPFFVRKCQPQSSGGLAIIVVIGRDLRLCRNHADERQ